MAVLISPQKSEVETKVVSEIQCVRCGGRWWPRGINTPKRCPKCHKTNYLLPPKWTWSKNATQENSISEAGA